MSEQQLANQNIETSLRQVRVDLGERAYQILISTSGWATYPNLAREWLTARPHWKTETPQVLIVTDDHVEKLFAARLLAAFQQAGWKAEVHVVPAGESSKSLEQISGIYDQLVGMQADRKTLVLALGGGVIGDLAGFAAASYVRGLPFLQIPTTLLADVDSSVGGKVGINHPQGKNLIGAFHQPIGVCIDTDCLQTLPDRDYYSGMAEVVKYGVIQDAEFFAFIEQNLKAIHAREPEILRDIIARSCRLKADVVEEDEYERTGLRAILNYGHTFAHAYEALAGYGQLMHGEAVSIGMMDACLLAEKLGRIDHSLFERQRKLLTELHLPVILPEKWKQPPEKYLACMRLDKKTVAGKLRFILPTRLGHVEMVSDVPESLVVDVLERTE